MHALDPVLCKREVTQRDAHAPQLESISHTPQLEKACAQQQKPSEAKKKKKKSMGQMFKKIIKRIS